MPVYFFKKKSYKSLVVVLFMALFASYSNAQTKKLNIQFTLPSSFTICFNSDSVQFSVSNVFTSGISNVYNSIKLPVGCKYISGSLKGANASEFNITNLNAPIFKLKDFSLAGNIKFSIKISADCNLQSYIGKGNQAYIVSDFTYTGGSETHNSGNINVLSPNILINSISNQVKNAYLNDIFNRETSIKNTGNGKVSTIIFFRKNGSGITVKSSRINDKYSADSVITKFDSTDFKKIGNNDKYFDGGEEIKITDTVKIINCGNLNSLYYLKFGCSNTICNTSSKNAIINLDAFTAGLTITPTSTINWCFDKSKPTSNGIVIINKSNKPIKNTSVSILQSYSGGFYASQMSVIDTATITVTQGKWGKKLKKKFAGFSYNNNGGYFTCLGAEPVGGMAFDLGEMLVGDTIYIKWNSISCIPDICNTTLTAHRWVYSASYYDLCGTSYSIKEAWGSYGGIQYLGALPWTPTDIAVGAPEKLNYTITTLSLISPTSKSLYTVKLNLQSGLKHSLKPDDIKFTDVDGVEWKPYKVSFDSKDIWAFFNNPKINLLKSELNVVINADCKGASSGLKDIKLSILYKIDSVCNSSYFQLYCANTQVKVHCKQYCNNGGMLFRGFKVLRKNYGLPDNNNDGIADGSGSIDMLKVKSNISFLYDTISANYSGVVFTSGSTNVFFNGKIKSTIANGNLISPVSTNLRIFRNGKLRYSCDKLQTTSFLSGTNRTVELDFTSNAAKTAGCGNFSNYFFFNGDSVVISLNFVYNTSIGSYSGEIFFTNYEYFLSTTPNPTPSQKLQCDTFSGKHILSGYYFTDYYTENYSSNTCNDISLTQSFYFSAGNCCNNYAGGNLFPFEYRNFNYLNKIGVVLPEGYKYSSASYISYFSKGTSKYSNQTLSSLKPSSISGDTMFFNLDTLFNPSKGVFNLSDEGYQSTLLLKIKPTCNSAINTLEPIKYLSYFKWRANNQTTINSNYQDFVQFNHPSILLSPVNSNSISNKDTFSWDVIVSNTYSGSNISNLWIANTTKTQANVIAVKDLGSGSFLTKQGDIFKAGNLSYSASRNFRIYAKTNNCRMDSIKICAGWNCDTYPDSFDTYKCKNLLKYTNLILNPIPPLINSVLFDDTARTDVCTNRKFQAVISNTDDENIYNLKLYVTIPMGTTFTDTGIYYSYPYGSKFTKLNKPIIVSGNTYVWNLSDSISALSKGLSKVSDTLKSKIKIQFYLETNCNITANSYVSIMPDGTMGCGESVRKIGYTGNPIRIKGVDNPYITSVKLSPDSVNLCKPFITLNAKIIYLGPIKTFSGDSIQLLLPKGFTPDTASLITKNVKGRGILTEVNKQIYWTWCIPPGTFPGDSSELSFKLKINNSDIACGNADFSLIAFTKKKAFCKKSNDSCTIKVSTGSYIKSFKLKKSNPYLTLIKSVSINSGDSGELADIVFNIKNDKNIVDSTFSSSFYIIADRNANSKFDASDFIISKFTKTQGLLPYQIISYTYAGFIKNTDICRLFIASDVSNCQCSFNLLPIHNLKLNNAGRDTAFCSNFKIKIGNDSVKNYKYEWFPSSYLKDASKSTTDYFKYNTLKTEEYKIYILKTTRPGSCFSQDTVKLTSNPAIFLPKLKDTSVICSGKSINIGDTAKGGKGSLSFSWSPSIGLSSSSKMIVNAGPLIPIKYYIKISDQNNCKISDSVYINISQTPLVKISYTGKCEKSDIQFTDISDYRGWKNGNTIWRINFNNIIRKDPLYTFDTLGLYFVRLVAENNYGCTDSAYKYVKIFGNPIIKNTKQNFCLGDSVIFIDSSSVAQMKIKQITWKFNSDSLIGNTVKKTFSNPGVIYFSQIAQSDSGCFTIKNDSIYISKKPIADFLRIKNCENDSIDISSSSTFFDLDSIVDYNWQIGTQTYQKSQLKVKFDSAGIYRIYHNVKTKNNCTDSIFKDIAINNIPKVDFGTKNFCNYDTILLDNKSLIKKGKIAEYKWELDDNKNYNYNDDYTAINLNEGLHKIKLTVTSDSACIDSVIKSFSIHPSLKTNVTFAYACENDTIKLSDITSQSKSKITARYWDIDKIVYSDSVINVKTGKNGLYPFKLIVVSAENCTYSLDSSFGVYKKPVADFDFISKCNDNIIDFNDKSTLNDTSKIVSRLWYLDYTPINSLDSTFTHKFTNDGLMKIKLIVNTIFSCSDFITKDINIAKPNFSSFMVNDVCLNDTVKLIFNGYTGTNKISKTTVKWGDGDVSYFLPTNHIYKNDGQYSINYKIETMPGCTYDTTRKITIHPLPQAAFTYYPPFPDIKNSKITITDKSTNAIKWYYSINNGLNLNEQNPVFNFTDSGKHRIIQFATNQFGCIDTAIRDIYVNYILLTYIPNAFSPGNDNTNPLFYPEGLGIKDYRMTIYNRWGEKVFESDWGKKPWDGTYKGEFVSSGMYHFFIQIRDYSNVRHDMNGVINVIK